MNNLPVLMYHAVSRLPGRLRRLGVPPQLLAEQLTRLRSEGYALVGLTEALETAAYDPTRAVVALTFDDAYSDFLDHAVPILQALDARATLYVPSAHVGDRAAWLGASAAVMPRLLDWDELRDCTASGTVEIGSHSHTHAQLDTLSAAALDQELVHSRDLLEARLEVEIRSFCYPHGYHSQAVRAAVQACGYDNACEVGRRLRSPQHRWSLSRLAVGPSDAPARVLANVRRGGPVVVPTVKRALQPTWRQVRRRSVDRRPAAS